MSAIFDYFVPHVHDEKVIVVVHKFLTDLIELGKKLEAFVVNQA